MLTKKNLTILLSLAILIAAYIWFFVYNKSHVDYQEQDAAFIGQADSLHQAAIGDQNAFRDMYINKAVNIKGEITESGTNTFKLGKGVFCTLNSSSNSEIPPLGKVVTVKGRVVGIDEDILTEEVICNLDQCALLQE